MKWGPLEEILEASPRDVVTNNNNHPMRRSTRIHRRVPLLVTSLDPKRRICEESHTVAINAHGCGILLRERIPCGTRVVIDLLIEQRQTRGIVIDAVPIDSSARDWLIGIEFEQFGNFWGLSDAPPDWRAGQEVNTSTGAHPQNQADAPWGSATVSQHPASLTDLSPFACYLETENTFPVGSPIEVQFLLEELHLRCVGVVRVVHPPRGMGLEFCDHQSDQQNALPLLLDLLIQGGKAAHLKTFVYLLTGAPVDTQRRQTEAVRPIDDPLLSLIANASAMTVEQFGEKLRFQRMRSPNC